MFGVVILSISPITFANGVDHGYGYGYDNSRSTDASAYSTRSREQPYCDEPVRYDHHRGTVNYARHPSVTKNTSPTIATSGFTPGLYIGAQAGWARADEGDGLSKAIDNISRLNLGLDASKDVTQGGFVGGRGYVGYQFAPIFGIEAGYSYYPNNTYQATGSFPTNYRYDFRFKTSVIDTMIKLMLPLGMLRPVFSDFTVYGKGGVGFVMNEFSGSYVLGPFTGKTDETSTSFRPTYGLGLAFNFTENTSIDISWTGILGYNRLSYHDVVSGNIHKDPTPNCNLYAAGFTYKFTNL